MAGATAPAVSFGARPPLLKAAPDRAQEGQLEARHDVRPGGQFERPRNAAALLSKEARSSGPSVPRVELRRGNWKPDTMFGRVGLRLSAGG